MAGVVGVDPGPLTFGELFQMFIARKRDEWSRAAMLACKIMTGPAERSDKQHWQDSDFNLYPYPDRKQQQDSGQYLTKDGFDSLIKAVT